MTMRDHLLNKVAASNLTINPHVLNVVQRVKAFGLHKTAAAIYSAPGEVTLRSAVELLGARLSIKHARHAKIAAAVEALNSLDDSDI